ncbi:Eco57I restriction-modification methylase domain-containing protein [Bizionia sediminis]|uniref:site-specific DNA-methyltransferase (adenine-specific) n=1 Tax=Bizionia sediminis TaxID=1737064 RepID=A0ABW5KSL8_9FLAO
MSLFQNSVLNNYLKGLESEKVTQAYERFTSHFHNPTIQENIRNSKEEQYQGEFLIDLFVNVLGYTKNPTPNFNLTTELKNIKGSKKTDGAILSRGSNALVKALAVIELKGTNITDLSKVETQAFGYKNNQPGCHYVITSNFEKLRFYIDNAVDFEEFNLFQLTKERFNILWLCLSADYLLKDIPKKIKDESLTQEENVTKKLYKDYASFRNEIFDAIQKENPAYDKLTLFKKTQKLLDRFLFIFFAEDRLLLPPNSIRSIVNQWTDLKDKYDEYFPLYDRFQKYFGYMNTGHKGQQHDIFAYNGGLFAPDDILDNIKINDELLYKHTLNLSNYDFESEVSVNILGHIFEHSLNDIDEIQAEIQGVTSDQSKTKRKKDGVFYTPKYITKYIVDNTVGKLCEEKKMELDIQEAEYEKERRGRKTATLKKLSQKLEDYRNWLLQITICDPACGSGAFLNQALEFLIAEHQYIDELQAKLFGDAMVLSEVENAILENNIYGVDINEESVEIAKLSLWLRTAQKGRKLTALNNNIKCGNSLIDDPTVAGDKAFNWQREFPDVFKEKHKKAYHITTALYDSRTSQRMIDYKVRERRELGTNPLPNYTKLTTEEEIIITQEIIAIAKEKQLQIMAYNICGDHIHLLLVCEDTEVSNIVKTIKGRTARVHNSNKGINPLVQKEKEKSISLWTQKYGCKAIKDDEQLYNTIAYIQNNRTKHELPYNKELQSLTENPILNLDYDTAFATQYKGGFDVIIGNPPYVRKQGLMEHYPEMCAFYETNYQSATANYDIYALFMERSFDLINAKGIVSYILPHKFLVTDFGVGIRQFFKEKQAVESILHFGSEMVFADASTYTCIINLDKAKKESVHFKKINPHELAIPFEWDYMLYDNLNEQNWDLQSQKVFDTIDTLKQQPYTVDDVFDRIFVGMQTSLDAVYVFEGKDMGSYIQGYNRKFDYEFEIEKELVKPILGGKDVIRYDYCNNPNFVLFPYEKDGTAVKEEYIKNHLPKTYAYLKHFETEIRGREKGKMDIDEGWFLYIYQKNHEKFPSPKIMTREISLGCNMTYDEKGEFYHNTKVYSFVKNEKFKVDDKFYLGILNSKVMWFFLKNTGSEYRGGYFVFKTNYLKPFPLPAIPENPNGIIDKVKTILSLNKHYQTLEGAFIDLLQSKFSVPTDKGLKPLAISKKLQNWHELDFAEFLKELEKARKKEAKNANKGYKPLALPEQAEWMQYFNEQKQKAIELKSEIEKTDKEIDAMVYALYGLTDDEIQIVEEATQ